MQPKHTLYKKEVSIKGLVTFTEEILNGKTSFFVQCYWKPYTSDSSTLTFTYQSDRPNLELRQERGTFCRVIRILRIKWKQRSKTDYTPCLAWSESHCYVPRYFGLPRPWKNPWVTNSSSAAHKKKFSMKDFFSKCNQICGFGHILLKKSLMKNFIFCAVI